MGKKFKKKHQINLTSRTHVNIEPLRLPVRDNIYTYTAFARTPKLEIHNRVVNILKLAMPSIAVIGIALLIVWPEIVEQKERFQLGITRPLIIGQTDTLSIITPIYYSTDSKNQPFKITSKLALETEPKSRIIALTDPTAEITLTDKTTIKVIAPKGLIDRNKNIAEFTGGIHTTTTKGHQLTTESILIDMKTNNITSHTPTTGLFPEGKISSEGLETKDNNQIIKFTGKAKLTLTSGSLPQK